MSKLLLNIEVLGLYDIIVLKLNIKLNSQGAILEKFIKS
jgi:hypothetical protein